MNECSILLQKQIKKKLENEQSCIEIHPQMKAFLEVINRSYNDYENDKVLLERSIDISSKEYIESIEKTNLLQTQLVNNEKMAGIGQLSAGIAHEINNPLGFVQSNMEILSEYIEKMLGLYKINQKIVEISEADRRLESIGEISSYIKANNMTYVFNDLKILMDENHVGLQRIEKIVRSLLGFSRVRNTNEFVEYDLNLGVKDTLVIANNEIKYNATIAEELETLPMIMALDGEINQVLLNIIVNASHAIKSKGHFGTIKVHTYADSSYVYCEIADDGIGIPAYNLTKIFEPFFTTKPIGSGTGLGLSIAHDIIVNKHKGHIGVNSTVGEGTSFLITLPIERE